MMNEPIMMGIDIWQQHFGNSTTIFLNEFLQMFKAYIAQYAKIYLYPGQINVLVSLVDPSELKTLDFLEFLLFFENFWLIPSKRMRLFKHKYPDSPTKYAVPPKFLHFTITNNLSKISKTYTYELFEEKILTIGNDPFINNLTIAELKNKIQLGFSQSEGGVLVRDYGKGPFRAKVKLSKDKFLLDDDMIIRIGKETILKIKQVSPKRMCEGNDRKHRSIKTKFKGFDDEMRQFFEILKKEEGEIRDVKVYREIRAKKEADAKVFNKIEEKFIEVEIIEGGINKRTFKLIPTPEKMEFIVGRGVGNKADLQVKDMSVSKSQCKIFFDKSCGWIISEVN